MKDLAKAVRWRATVLNRYSYPRLH